MEQAAELYVGAAVAQPKVIFVPVPAAQPPAFTYESVVGTTLLLFIIIIIVVSISTSSLRRTVVIEAGGMRAHSGKKSRKTLRFNRPSSALFSPITECVKKTGLPPVAPLWWDNEEGAYMIQLRVGKGDVEFVLDTGSSLISAKGPGCKWTNCVKKSCSTTSCPCGLDATGKERTDCSLHYYNPAGKPLKPGEGGAGTSTVLTYGSQEDTVSHYDDVVALPHVTLSCSQLEVQVPQGAHPAESYHSLGNVVVHRVSHIMGSSSSNLLGLACPPDVPSTEASNVVLQKLFGGFDAQWSLVLRPQGGWWAMGPLTCFTDVKFMPLLNPPEFNQFVTKFYIVPIRSIAVGRNEHTLKTLPSHETPRFCLIDTGTTLTYGSTKLGDALKKKGWNERTSYFQIQLGDKERHVTITYSPTQMRDPDYPDSSVLQVDRGRTLDDFDTIFPSGGSCVLFGVLMMRNMMWYFDLAENRVGVQELPRLSAT